MTSPTREQLSDIRRYIDANPHLSATSLTYHISGWWNVIITREQVEAIRIRAGGHGRTPRSRMDSLTAPKE